MTLRFLSESISKDCLLTNGRGLQCSHVKPNLGTTAVGWCVGLSVENLDVSDDAHISVLVIIMIVLFAA